MNAGRSATTFAVWLIAVAAADRHRSDARAADRCRRHHGPGRSSATCVLGTALAEAAGAPHDWLGLGRVDAGPLVLVLARDRAEFARWSHGRVPSWGAGATFPGSRVVIIRLDAGDPYQTLRHELAHVVLHQAVHGRVPLWFDEGYAVLAAQEIRPVRGPATQPRGGDWARCRNCGRSTARCEEETNDAETAYALAGSAVAELARRGRNGELAPLMDELEAGRPVRRRGGDQHRLYRRSVRGRVASIVAAALQLVVWLATGGMWLVVTLILSWAAATRRRREAPRRAALDVGWPEPPADDETITIQEVGPHST